MADFSAADLLDRAKKRFGERKLRDKIRGAEGEDSDARDDAADVELLFIARSVIGRAATALQSSGGWPLPGIWPPDSFDPAGEDISGMPFSEIWPYDLLEKAIELFWGRVLWTGEAITTQETKMAAAAEGYFNRLEEGAVVGTGGPQDVSQPLVVTVRDRSGRSRVGGVSDNISVLEDMDGPGWDFNR